MKEKYHWKIFTVGIKEAFAGMEVKSHFLWLFTSFFPIFSIPSVKQNKKRQRPKGSKLFFINKVSIFISLKTQLLSNPPHPSMVFFYFCFFCKISDYSPSQPKLLGQLGCSATQLFQHRRNPVQVIVLVPAAPWGTPGSDGGPRTRDCTFLCWAHFPEP